MAESSLVPQTLPNELRTFTFRETRVIQGLIEGLSDRAALMKAGFSVHLAEHPSWTISPAMREFVLEQQQKLVRQTVEQCLFDATEAHYYLTDALRANVRDIMNDDFTFKPLSEWPEVWQRLYEGGDVEIERKKVRSHDGQDKETEDGAPEHGWEDGGTVITKVKCRFRRKAELLKLAMMHKGVNAMVEQRAGDTTFNVTVVTAQAQRLSRARERLAKVIDVTPERSAPVSDPTWERK